MPIATPAEMVFTKPGAGTCAVLVLTTESGVPGVYGMRMRLRTEVPASATGGAVFSDAGFRLPIDGVPRAPEASLSELVPRGSAKEAELSFEVPDGTQTLPLHIVHHNGYNVTADLPLAIQGAGVPRVTPSGGRRPRNVSLDVQKELTFTKPWHYTCTVLGTSTKPGPAGHFTLRARLLLRVHSSGGNTDYWDDSFRLLVDGASRAPTSSLNAWVPSHAAGDGNITFDVPDNAKTLALRVIHHSAYGLFADLPLTLGPQTKK